MTSWVKRSARRGGTLVRWRERTKPGAPGTVERVYDDPPERDADANPVPLKLAGSRRPIRSRARRTASTASAVTVSLSERARRAIVAVLEEDRETGGSLIGYERVDGSIVVEIAYAQEYAKRNSRFFQFDVNAALREERFHLGAGWRWIGDFHSHPNGSEPSEIDKRGWTSMRTGRYVGLLVTASSSDPAFGWLYPAYRGWIAENGKLRPAEVLR